MANSGEAGDDWVPGVNGSGQVGYGAELKNLAGFRRPYIFALLSRKPVKRSSLNAALVNRLRRLPFTEE